MRQLSYTAPDQLRERFKGLSTIDLVAEAAALRPRPGADPVAPCHQGGPRQPRSALSRAPGETDHVDSLLAGLVEECAPVAGDNPGRLHSQAAFARLRGVAPIEASSGKVLRILKRYVARDVFRVLPRDLRWRAWPKQHLPPSGWLSLDMPARPRNTGRLA